MADDLAPDAPQPPLVFHRDAFAFVMPPLTDEEMRLIAEAWADRIDAYVLEHVYAEIYGKP